MNGALDSWITLVLGSGNIHILLLTFLFYGFGESPKSKRNTILKR